MSTSWDAWNYRQSARRTPGSGSLVGYHVHATDGDIGKIDEASDEVGTSRIVVDTGPWIFGRKVVLPAGTVQRVDDADRMVYVDLTKDQIKNSPELDESTRVTTPPTEAASERITATSTDDHQGRPVSAGHPGHAVHHVRRSLRQQRQHVCRSGAPETAAPGTSKSAVLTA